MQQCKASLKTSIAPDCIFSPVDDRPVAIVLAGPTASGKTDLAIQLMEHMDCDIISVDSAMVYRGMDIGTAKPSRQCLATAPHRLIDIRDPAESYSAADFRSDALSVMHEVTAAGRIPLLVGGTMLYFRALISGLSPLPEGNPEVRASLDKLRARDGLAALHARLAAVDPVAAQRIHPNDPQRIQRALEVYELTGMAMSVLQARSVEALPWRVIKIGLGFDDRAVLHQRIAIRLSAMFRDGLLDEVAALFQRGDLNRALPSMRAVGYRQIWAHLVGELDLDAAIVQAEVATRQLAKRQITWMRRERYDLYLDTLGENLVGKVLQYLEQVTI